MNETTWAKFLKEDISVDKNSQHVFEDLSQSGESTLIFFDIEDTGLQITKINAFAVDPLQWFEKAEIIDVFRVDIKTEEEQQDILEKFEEFIQGFKHPLLISGVASQNISSMNDKKMTRMPKVKFLDAYPVLDVHHKFTHENVESLMVVLKKTIEQMNN